MKAGSGRRVGVVLAVPAILGGSGAAFAQSAYGPGGMMVHPSALVRGKGDTTAGLSWFRQERSGVGNEWSPFTVVAGIDGKSEVGVQWVRRVTRGGSADNGGLFAKVRLLEPSDGRPALALVASHVGGPISLTSFSLASTWSVPGAPDGTLVHAGLQWAQRADLSPRRSDTQPYLGVQIPVAQRLNALAEVGSKFAFDPKARLGLGLSWTTPGGPQVTGGVVNIGRSDNPGLFFGVGYPIGGGKR